MPPPLKGSLLGLAGFGIYALADASIKFLGGSYSPVQIIAYAGLFSFPLLALLQAWHRGPLRPARPGLMAVRTLTLIINSLLVTYVLTVLPLAQAYALFFTLPLMITLMAWPVLGEKVDLVSGVAVLLGLGGVVIALNPEGTELQIGHLAALFGAFTAAIHYVIIRRTGAVEGDVPQFLYPLIGQTLVALLLLPGQHVPMPASDLLIVAGLSVAGLTGTLLMFAAYRAAPPIVVAPMQYSQIGWAAVFGAVLFDEPMGWALFAGMIVIAVAGIIVVTRQGRKTAPLQKG
jgi:S-adenosylmethionine uptake transporter